MLKEGAIRTEFLTKVRVTPCEKKEVKERCEDLKMTESEYIRRCINKEMQEDIDFQYAL